MPINLSHPNDIRDLRRWTKWLSGVRLEGRGVGSNGGYLASEWIGRQMDKFGLALLPNEEARFQAVPMCRASIDYTRSGVFLLKAGSQIRLDGNPDFCFRSRLGEALDVSTELVLVGYGIVAPELNRNDYSGIDVRGAIVIILCGETTEQKSNLNAEGVGPMSYYGRWTYKLEEAGRQGAYGAILIHDEHAVGYPFEHVRTSFSSSYTYLSTNKREISFEGWCSEALGHDLLLENGITLASVKEMSLLGKFRAVKLPSSIGARIYSSQHKFVCRNVVGIVPGSDKPNEIVVFVAHWDHLGSLTLQNGEVKVFPGAADNATGVSLLLSLARRCALSPRPKRTVLFLASTGEETGFLGAQHFVQTLSFGADQIVAAFNIDGILPIGRTRDLQLIGTDFCNIDSHISKVFEMRGRVISTDDQPQLGYYYRADQFAFAQAGIPAVQVATGSDLLNGGLVTGMQKHAQYDDERYHTERDMFDSDWDFAGVAEDGMLLWDAGRHLANSSAWPKWHPGVAFSRSHTSTLESQ